ncbi:hypothetical protein JP32_11730 [Gallibacterium anatis]|uniref:DUF2681 domain-containing protein n=2 Tax=Gallibacterium anatis TaxID=750 RepID=A0A0A2XDY0_9PAST|nr:hypothetical protein JP32_11730 [Gallibacterium anatis]
MMGLIYLAAAVGVVFVIGLIYVRQQSQKIAKQRQEIETVKAEARAIAEEMENAEKSKQIEQANRRLTAHGVDEQLQSKGYFRED